MSKGEESLRRLEAALQKGLKSQLLQLARANQLSGTAEMLFYQDPREIVFLPWGRKHIQTRPPNTMESESCNRRLIDYIENWKPKDIPSESRDKIPWNGNPTQLVEFFRFVFDPDADFKKATCYFAVTDSKDKKISTDTPKLKTRLRNNHLLFVFKKAEEFRWLFLEHRNVALSRIYLDRQGEEFKNLGKKGPEKISDRSRQMLEDRLRKINSLAQ